jgi:outer membrane protein OmpA-like peptidoglycan-associated protein
MKSKQNFAARGWTRVAGAGIVASALIACAPTPVVPEGAVQTRAELARLQADAKLAPLAQQALTEAEAAVQLAEQTSAEPEVAAHRVYLAQRKVELARALAEARYAEQERAALTAQLDKARLEAREREAAAARMEADTARMQTAAIQAELEAMKARPTDRGLVLTLGDVLFETGKADLKAGAVAELDELAKFLAKYPDRTVAIEGHTDSVGSDDFNVGLSQRRAESVRSYLMRQGVDRSRVTTQGMGESVPVASNDTAGGRQQNRRVEIIVSNPTTPAATPASM